MIDKNFHPLVQLAQAAIREYLLCDRVLTPSPSITQEMQGKAGVFVSLKKYGRLRGCIGTISATTGNLAEEVIQNAIRAASRDGRFPPVQENELDQLDCTVDVLSPLEPVRDVHELDPKTYGVLVRDGSRKGLLLPDLPEVTSAQQQLAIAKEKAAILPHESCTLFRFQVKRYR
jgi:AmmeMemoRadiSam system protein A